MSAPGTGDYALMHWMVRWMFVPCVISGTVGAHAQHLREPLQDPFAFRACWVSSTKLNPCCTLKTSVTCGEGRTAVNSLSILKTLHGWVGFQLRASIRSGCRVRIRLWPRLPRDCHRLLSIVPMYGASAERSASWCSSLDPASASYTFSSGRGGGGIGQV